jgi:uncharacterized protein DUF5610
MFSTPLHSPIGFPPKLFQGHHQFRPHVDNAESKVADRPVRTDRSMQRPPQKAVDILGKTLQREGIDLQGLAAEDFRPEKIADRILNSVAQAFGQFKQNRPDADDDAFFTQVTSGIEKGFDEAKDILQNLGVLQGQIAEDIDTTYDLTMDGLAQMQADAPQTADTVMALQSMMTASSRSAQMQIETSDGDIVTIDFSQAMTSSRTAFEGQGAGVSVSAYQEDYAMSSGFNISIEGELDADEQKSVKKLMQQMHKVSNQFFNGNGKAALKHALKIGFDSEQIAGFSMDLSMQRSMQAVSAYQQTANPDQTVAPDLLAQAGDFFNQAKAMLVDAENALQSLADPQQRFKDLFTEIGSLVGQDSVTYEEETDAALLNELSQGISKDLFAQQVLEEAV